MDRLHQLYAQLAGHVRAMTPGSRIVAASLAAVAALSLGYLCVFPLGDSEKIAARSPAQLPSVAGGRAEPDDPVQVAIDKDSILLLPDQRQALYTNAEEKAIERELTDFFKDVAKATVNLKNRVETRRGRPHNVPTASVAVKMKPGMRLGRDVGAMICNYVAAATGRDPAEVVAFDPGHGTRFHGTRDGAIADEQVDRRALEQECQDKIRGLLNSIPGATIVVSACSATERKEQPRDVPASAGSMAATSNQPRQLPTLDDEGIRSAAAYETGPRAAAGPLFRVAIRVPQSHFERLRREQMAAAGSSLASRPDPVELETVERREIDRIRRLAASVLPPSDGESDGTDAVTVVAFRDGAAAEASPSVPPTARSRLAEYGPVLGTVALAVMAFVAVRRLARRTSAAVDRKEKESGPPVGAAPLVAAAPPRRDDPSGIALDGQLARRLIERHQAKNESSAAPFGSLQKTDPRRIAHILGDEQPQTIALVLAHLAPRQAGHVLACLAPQTQSDALRRLVDLEQTDSDVLREIERSLASRLADDVPMQTRRTAGLAAVARIMEASRQPIGRAILDNVAARDRSLADQLDSYIAPPADTLDLDDLVQLDLSSRAALCEAAGEDLLALALVGAPTEIVEPMLAAVPPGRDAAIRRSLECPGPTRLSDVDAARGELVELARTMAAAGRLSLAEQVARP